MAVRVAVRPSAKFCHSPRQDSGIFHGRCGIGATETVLNIAGGVALLLWGTRMVRTGMTRAFGADLRRALAAGTQNRFRAFLTGIGVTALLQSSTATALIASSFTAQKLVATTGAIAIVLGADVGTTLVAQVLSLDLRFLTPLLLLVGVVSYMASNGGQPRHLGRIAIGLGLILLALQMILAAASPIGETDTLLLLLGPLGGEQLLVILVAAILTWLAHSSLATVLLVMSLVTAGAIGVPLALLLVVGANIGGAVAPVVMTLRSPPAGRRIPLANAGMRLVGAVIIVPFLPLITILLLQIESDSARLVANFHTFFNVTVAVIFLPWVHLVARLSEWVLPDRPEEEEEAPRYLDMNAVDTPAVALASAARETLRMGDIVDQMLRQAIDALMGDDSQLVRDVAAMDDRVDRLHEAIKAYMAKVSEENLDHQEGRYFIEILSFATNLEHVGDIIDKNLLELANKKIRNRLRFSREGLKEIRNFHARVQSNMQLAFNVFLTRDRRLARQLLDEKVAVRDAELKTSGSHFERYREGLPETRQTSGLHLDIVRDLKRINSHISSVAYAILEEAGELRESRLRQVAE